jgi:hypothetical protein
MVNAVPSVVTEADNDTRFGKSSLVVVTECKERESFLVPIVVFIDASYTRVRFVVENRLLVEV